MRTQQANCNNPVACAAPGRRAVSPALKPALPLLLAVAVLSFPSLGVVGLAAGSEGPKTTCYDAKGTVRGVDFDAHQVTISHDRIPGYMDAMTMDFDVRDTAELNDVQPGDTVGFRLCVTDNGAWIEHLRRLAPGTSAVAAPKPATASQLGPGDLFPDIPLVDQRGRSIRLSNFRGSVLALTFIYTRCPLPTYCPLMSRNFQAAQGLLDRLEVGDRCRFLSISLDSRNDTPEVLTDYAARYQADPGRWTFAGGSGDEVRALGAGVGLEYTVADGLIYHNLRTVVLDRRGRIRRVFSGNRWTPQELAAEMRSAASR